MWKKLSDEARRNIDENRAFALMAETPSLVKRFVLVRGRTQMSEENENSKNDESDDNYALRFLLDDLDIRGTVARIGSVWRQMLGGRGYPPPVAQLLGEMSATTLLIGSNLKRSFKWKTAERGGECDGEP